MNFNDFTYGFEVEGIFDARLIEELVRSKWEINTQRDGSVHASTLKTKVRENFEEYENIEEVSVGIFSKYHDFVETLGLFNSENHLFDNSCGLHIHIKPKKKQKETEAKICDMSFIKKLQYLAFHELCDHVTRRNKNSYCIPYTKLDETRREWRAKAKYHFIRKHNDYGTLEFRFMAPCEHKVQNVKKFFEFFIKELRKVQPKKELTLTLAPPIKQRKDFSYSINRFSSAKLLRANYSVNTITKEKNARYGEGLYYHEPPYPRTYQELERMIRGRTLAWETRPPLTPPGQILAPSDQPTVQLSPDPQPIQPQDVPF